MSSRIYVTSAEGNTGKSTIAVGLLAALTESGRTVSVFRPFVRSLDRPDPILEVLLEHSRKSFDPEHQVDSALCIGTDYDRQHNDPEAALRQVVERIAALERRTGADTTLILGSDYTDVGTPTELATNGRVAANLAAGVVLAISGRGPDGDARAAGDVAESAALAIAELRAEYAQPTAVVVSRADPERMPDIVAAVRAAIPGLPSWAIPEDEELTAPLLGDLMRSVQGELIAGDPTALNEPVRGTVVAAMSLENVLPRLVERGIVVVPGDRGDVVLGSVVAHLSRTFPSLAGILINGIPLSPGLARLIEGLGAQLPIMQCALDSYDTALRITSTRSLLAADSPDKYERALTLCRRHLPTAELLAAVSAPTEPVMTPTRFEHSLIERAAGDRKRIVLPESGDDRVIRAAGIVVAEGIADLVLVGDPVEVAAHASALGVDLGSSTVLSALDPELHERFTDDYARIRAHKGITREQAELTMRNVSYFGTMLVHSGLADGMVSGATHTTAETVRPAFEIVKTAPGVSVVSSVFLMALADRVLVYGDCAIIPEPTPEELADIAISSAETARRFGIEPRVAMLSYSTGESGTGAEVERVRTAAALVHERAPGLPVVGPIQYDAAADPVVAGVKMPGDLVAGHATVFIFPDLNTGNNTYKAVQRSAGALAIGPVLQGLARPINDLSRGATVRDIVNTIALTAIQAQDRQRQ